MQIPGRVVRSFGSDAPPAAEDWGIVLFEGRDWLAQGASALMPAAEVGIAGAHNAANALAAMALCREIGVATAPMLAALRGFRGLPHRMQPVAEIGAVTFYDDSKGTNVGATIAALSGLGRRSVLIAGGDGKGQDFAPLAEAVRRHARAVVLIGKDREAIAAALARTGIELIRAQTFEQAIRLAHAAAAPGDGVLLSPACASYDMFRDYVHRGEEFARLARSLAHEAGSAH